LIGSVKGLVGSPQLALSYSDDRFIAAADRQPQMKRAGAIATGSTILVSQETAAARGQIKRSPIKMRGPVLSARRSRDGQSIHQRRIRR